MKTTNFKTDNKENSAFYKIITDSFSSKFDGLCSHRLMTPVHYKLTLFFTFTGKYVLILFSLHSLALCVKHNLHNGAQIGAGSRN